MVALTGAVSAVLVIQQGMPWWVGVLAALAHRPARRRLAGLLGGVRRHPRLHRDPGRHAALPRPDPAGARQHLAVAVPAGVPRGSPAASSTGCSAGTGYDAFTLLIGAIAVAGYAVSAFRTRVGPDPRTSSRWSRFPLFVARSWLVGAVVMAFAWQLAARPRPADRADHPGRAGPRLRPGHQADRLRPAGLRHRRQPVGGARCPASRSEGRQLLDLRQHGLPGRGRRASSTPPGPTAPSPTAGNMFELDAIAAAFIGGAAVTGGVGTVVGAMVGGLIMAVDEQRHAAHGRRPADPVRRQGSRAAAGRRLRRLQQAPRRRFPLTAPTAGTTRGQGGMVHPAVAAIRPLSMADVAARAGVSHQTVSRVVNGHPSVAPATRERVEQAIAELGYRPNVAARALVTGSTRTIGLVTVKINQYGPAQTLLGLEKAARAAGYSLSVSILDDATAGAMRDAVDAFVAQRVDAIVALSTYDDAAEALATLEPPVPLVAVQVGGDEDRPAVGVDQEAGARLAIRHLLQLGHRTVHHVAGPVDSKEARGRIAGWRAELEAAGAPVPEPLRGDWTPSSGYAAGRQLADRIRAGERRHGGLPGQRPDGARPAGSLPRVRAGGTRRRQRRRFRRPARGALLHPAADHRPAGLRRTGPPRCPAGARPAARRGPAPAPGPGAADRPGQHRPGEGVIRGVTGGMSTLATMPSPGRGLGDDDVRSEEC